MSTSNSKNVKHDMRWICLHSQVNAGWMIAKCKKGALRRSLKIKISFSQFATSLHCEVIIQVSSAGSLNSFWMRLKIFRSQRNFFWQKSRRITSVHFINPPSSATFFCFAIRTFSHHFHQFTINFFPSFILNHHCRGKNRWKTFHWIFSFSFASFPLIANHTKKIYSIDSLSVLYVLVNMK